jgi:hypothetical protein
MKFPGKLPVEGRILGSFCCLSEPVKRMFNFYLPKEPRAIKVKSS